MHILYGVQATGQGHISRARAMAKALREHDVQVSWLFSGRPRDRLFDMQPFGDFMHRRGLTFATQTGSVRYLRTALSNNLPRFLYDAQQLDLSAYDLVVTDYEPLTAWACKWSQRDCIGIGHQYAFGPSAPVDGDTWLSRWIMRNFAPVTRPVGLHWHAYRNNVLPPILDLPNADISEGNYYLVYLPFEDQGTVTRWLQSAPDHRFVQYSGAVSHGEAGNVQRHPASVEAFKRHLAGCRGVICNSGFELISECIHWQKPVLTRPLMGQMEQLSNALSLKQLGHAQVMDSLDTEPLHTWLAAGHRQKHKHYPDVAQALAGWLAQGAISPVHSLSQTLWQQTPSSVALQRHGHRQCSMPNPLTEALTT